MKDLRVTKDRRIIQSRQDISKFESDLNVKVPENLVEFLLLYEGLLLGNSQNIFNRNETQYNVDSVLHLRYEKDSYLLTMEEYLLGYRNDNVNHFLPFARDPWGNHYSYWIGEENYGQIWYTNWYEDEDNTFLANSLEAFINALQPHPNPPE